MDRCVLSVACTSTEIYARKYVHGGTYRLLSRLSFNRSLSPLSSVVNIPETCQRHIQHVPDVAICGGASLDVSA